MCSPLQSESIRLGYLCLLTRLPALQTWLLQPCLGGDAKMLMVANVAPTAAAAAESLCSLRFAAKVNATHIGTARRAVSYAK